MGTVCVICHTEKKGAPINDDLVIRSIRRGKGWVNGFFRNYAPSLMRFLPDQLVLQNNVLVVCNNCLEEHTKRRTEFEKKLVRFGALGGIIAILLILLARTPGAVLSGLVVVALMLLFALPFYHPSLASYPEQAKITERKRKKTKK